MFSILLGLGRGFGADFRTRLRCEQASRTFVPWPCEREVSKGMRRWLKLWDSAYRLFAMGKADSRLGFHHVFSSPRLVTGGKERKWVLRSGARFADAVGQCVWLLSRLSGSGIFYKRKFNQEKSAYE